MVIRFTEHLNIHQIIEILNYKEVFFEVKGTALNIINKADTQFTKDKLNILRLLTNPIDIMNGTKVYGHPILNYIKCDKLIFDESIINDDLILAILHDVYFKKDNTLTVDKMITRMKKKIEVEHANLRFMKVTRETIIIMINENEVHIYIRNIERY